MAQGVGRLRVKGATNVPVLPSGLPRASCISESIMRAVSFGVARSWGAQATLGHRLTVHATPSTNDPLNATIRRFLSDGGVAVCHGRERSGWVPVLNLCEGPGN